ncbi:polyketide synthase dehydratase domain-containing protein [Streptomyces sp. NPDC093591]|uniref:polyketide synthase dehydratase domain-containing protein n=1 Tax=Streptomyces sp. NPDC093591 TaxID=3366044 RepID=UPI003805AE40
MCDGALQATAPLFAHAADGRMFLPAAIESARLWQQPPAHGLIHVALRHLTASDAVVDVTVSQEDGTVAAQLTGRRLHAVTTRTSSRSWRPYCVTHLPWPPPVEHPGLFRRGRALRRCRPRRVGRRSRGRGPHRCRRNRRRCPGG